MEYTIIREPLNTAAIEVRHGVRPTDHDKPHSTATILPPVNISVHTGLLCAVRGRADNGVISLDKASTGNVDTSVIAAPSVSS